MHSNLSNSVRTRSSSFARGLALASALAIGVSSASAAIIFVPGHHNLQPNLAGQPITIAVNNTGPAFDIITFNLTAIVGDGGPILGGTPAPIIGGPGGVDLHTGTPFGPTYDPGSPELDVNGIGAFEMAQWSITALEPVTVPTGLTTLGTILVDTTGYGPGDGPWQFRLGATLAGLGVIESELVFDGEVIGATFEDGSFTIVPEPEVWASGTGAALLLGALIRRRLKTRAA